MAEFKDIVHIYNQHCLSRLKAGKPCAQCFFHYLKNDKQSGCINFLVHYPDKAEKYLLDWAAAQDVCTMCGKQLDEWDRQENFGFDYRVGYGSKHDCEHIRARFCCECFDNLLDHIILESKYNPIVGELHLEGETPWRANERQGVAENIEEKG